MARNSVTGDNEIIERMKRIARQHPAELAAALYTESELLMFKSKEEIPVDTGAAKSSAHVDAPVISTNKVSIEFGYGGTATKVNPKSGKPTTTYLIRIHEDMDMRHTVGKAKFLEDPVKAWTPTLVSTLMRRVQTILRRNTI